MKNILEPVFLRSPGASLFNSGLSVWDSGVKLETEEEKNQQSLKVQTNSDIDRPEGKETDRWTLGEMSGLIFQLQSDPDSKETDRRTLRLRTI